MAGGALVPYEISPGRTVMVPDYLVPQQQPPQALALPPMAPPAAPDQRLAFNGPGGPQDLGGAPDPSVFAAEDAQATQARNADALRQKLAPAAPPADHGMRDKEPGWMPTGQGVPGGKKPTAGVDPSSLVRAGRAQPQTGAPDANGGMDPLVRRVFNEGGGRPGGMTVGSIKQERTPGENLLPEQLWRSGLAPRPADLYERDPNVPVSTIGTEAPTMREKLTPIEQGAQKTGEYARSEYEQQVQAQQEQSVAYKAQLAGQSQLLDQQLGTIADRRARLAQMQDTADQRQQEAQSIEPRTRAEVWGSKGQLGRGLAVIAAVFGGLAGNNNGWKMVEQSVNDAVDDDRYKFERAQKLGMNARNDFERAMAIYGDQDIASLDVKNRKLANVLAMTQQQINDRGIDAMAKQRGEQLYQQVYGQYLDGVRQQRDLITGKAVKEEVDYKPGVAGGGGPTTLQRLKNAAEAKKAEDTINGTGGPAAKGEVILPDGSSAYAANDSDASEVQKVIRSSDEVKQYVARLKQLTSDAASRTLTSDERAAAEVIQSALVPKLHDALGVKTFRKDVAELMEKMRGDPAHFFRNPNTAARLDEVTREMDQNVNNQLRYLHKTPRRGGGGGESETAAPSQAPSAQDEGDE